MTRLARAGYNTLSFNLLAAWALCSANASELTLADMNQHQTLAFETVSQMGLP
jgi:hypothetical protein